MLDYQLQKASLELLSYQATAAGFKTACLLDVHRCCPRQAVVDARKTCALHSELGFSGLVARDWMGIDFIRIFGLSSYVLCNPFMPSRIRIDSARAEVNKTETSS